MALHRNHSKQYIIFDHDWIEFISVFSQQLLVESISSVVSQIVSTSGEKLKAKGKKNAFNKPSSNTYVGTFTNRT